MIKRFNWGWGIALLYTSFAVFILFMVYLSTREEIELVTPDYYAKELDFQQQIDKINRANQLREPVKWKVNNRQVHITFPKQITANGVKANTEFYRPNDKRLDFSVECQPDSNGVCVISSDRFYPGIYKMGLNWESNGVTYYNEGVINID